MPDRFPAQALEELHRAFLPLLDDVISRIPAGNRGSNRWAIGLPFAQPFYQSVFFVDDDVDQIVAKVLGDDTYVSYFGTDTPTAGAEQQKIHADFPLLFPEEAENVYPPYVLLVRFATVDTTLENGPFETTERTQRLQRSAAVESVDAGEIPVKAVLLQAGDVLITDPRLLHRGYRGSPNRTRTPRTFAVIAHHRSWHVDHSFDQLEANESTPMLLKSFYASLSQREQHFLRWIPRSIG